jgi:hypothetical protein
MVGKGGSRLKTVYLRRRRFIPGEMGSFSGGKALSLEATVYLQREWPISSGNGLSPAATVYFQRKRSISGGNGLSLEAMVYF